MSKPIVLSSFSGIAQKVSYLAQIIRNESEADATECYLVSEVVDGKKVIRIGTLGNTHVWTYLPIYERASSEVLDRAIKINLFDFHGCLEACPDDIIKLTLDTYEDGVDLIVSSYYDDQNEWDELVIRLAAHEIKDVPSIEEPNTKAHFYVSAMTSFAVMGYFNSLQFKNILVDFTKDSLNLSGQNEDATFTFIAKDKTMNKCPEGVTYSIDIPFELFALMNSTGQVTDVKIAIDDNSDVFCKTQDFGFHIKNSNDERPPIEITECQLDGFIMSTPDAKVAFEALNTLGKSSKTKVISIEKVTDAAADLVLVNPDRMMISIRAKCAALSEGKFETSLLGVRTLFAGANTDALRIKHDGDGNTTIFYENGWSIIRSRFNKNLGSIRG